MERFPKKLQKKLIDRANSDALRTLNNSNNLVDFSSNDYISFAGSKEIFSQAHQWLLENQIHDNGATGSRLISGNHELYDQVEKVLTNFHEASSALLFNSGYDANVGFFSSIPQRGDLIFYDEFIHASIRDGIRISYAKSYKFLHNDIPDLEKKLLQLLGDPKDRDQNIEVYVVTESVFSMDGDSPDIVKFVEFCQQHNCHLIIDEAHATGVFGDKGKGIVQELELQDKVFARIHTFGKALGCHGAVILGSIVLKNYLINFARSFIYTTGLPPHSLITIHLAYKELEITTEITKLHHNIRFFNQQLIAKNLNTLFIESISAIHCCVISGNERVREVAKKIQAKGFDVKPILSPTVPLGKERLRFCLHSYNSEQEIAEVLSLLATFVTN